MKNRLVMVIALLVVVFFSGCELSLANDAVAKAALRDSTVTTVAPAAEVSFAVDFSVDMPAEETEFSVAFFAE